MKKRRLLIFFISLIIGFIVIPITAYIGFILFSISLRNIAAHEMIREIKNNRSKENLIKLVESSDDGILIELNKPEWIALIYRNMHDYWYDVTVYLDSRGRFLVSYCHFCRLKCDEDNIKRLRQEYINFPSKSMREFVRIPVNEDDKKQVWIESWGGDNIYAYIVAYEELDIIYGKLIESGLFTPVK